eukprot:gene11879-15413_t
MANRVRATILAKAKGKNCYVGLDGATLNKKRHLNFHVSVGENTIWFWRSVRVEHFDGETIAREIRAVIDELRRGGTHVFSLVTDNARAMINAMDEFSGGDEEKIETGLTDEAVDAAVKYCSENGAFAWRCCAHSFQLVMKDAETDVPFVGTAVRAGRDIIEQFKEVPEKHTALLAAQTALGKPRPKGMLGKMPGDTRWNSNVDCWARALELKALIQGVGVDVKSSEWEAMEKARLVMEPVATATDVVQSDAADAETIFVQLEEVEAKIEKLKDVPGLQNASKALLRVFRKRLEKNFTNDAILIYRFTHPKVDQSTWPVAQKEAALALLLKYATFCKKRHSGPDAELDAESITAAVGDFLGRSGDHTKDFQTYWRCKMLSQPDLSRFLLALAWLCITA